MFSWLIPDIPELFLTISVWFRLQGWEDNTKLGFIIGNTLTTIFYILRLAQDTLLAGVSRKLIRDYELFDLSKSETLLSDPAFSSYHDVLFNKHHSTANASSYNKRVRKVTSTVYWSTYFLLLLSCYTCYRLFNTYKVYRIYYLKDLNLDKHPSLKKIEPDYEVDEKLLKTSLKSKLLSRFIRLLQLQDEVETELPKVTEHYTLNKWDPSKLIISLSISFSPTIIICLMYTNVTFLTVIPIIIHQGIFYFMIWNRYEERFKDDALLMRENYLQYDTKYVKPLKQIMYQDVMTDTATISDGGFTKFFPVSKSALFKHHEMSGDVIIERYNKKSREFENVTDIIKPHHHINNTVKILPPIIRKDHKTNRYDHRQQSILKDRKFNIDSNEPQIINALTTAIPSRSFFNNNPSGSNDDNCSGIKVRSSPTRETFFPATPLRKK